MKATGLFGAARKVGRIAALDTEWKFKVSSSKQLRNPRTNQAENNGRRERNKYLPPKNLEPNIPWQTPKTQLLQPRRDRVDEQQRQENNNEPARHNGLQRVSAVTLCKAQGLPLGGTESNDFEQLTHLVFGDELLRHAFFVHRRFHQRR